MPRRILKCVRAEIDYTTLPKQAVFTGSRKASRDLPTLLSLRENKQNILEVTSSQSLNSWKNYRPAANVLLPTAEMEHKPN